MTQEYEQPKPAIEGKETRSCGVLAASFLAAFTAYLAIQNLQSSLNQQAGLGTISLSVQYACIVFSGILSPAVIRWFGVKNTIILSWICHLIYTGSNFYPAFFTLIPSSVILGTMSGVLWTCQSIYTTMCSFSLVSSTGQSTYTVLSKLNGLFFTVYETTQIPGNLVSSLVFQTGTNTNGTTEAICGPGFCPLASNGTDIATPGSEKVYIMLGIYLAFDITALVITVFFLPPLPKSNWSANTSLIGSLSSLFVTLFTSKMIFLVPFIMYQAVEQAVLWGDYTLSYVSCPIGIHMVGFVMATYGVVTSLSALLFSRVAKYTGRYLLFCAAASSQAGLFTVLFLWTPTQADTKYIFMVPMVWGMGEGIWQTQSNSLIALLFPDNKEPAFANFVTWKAIGFTVTFVLSEFVCLRTKLIFVLSLLAVAMVLYTGVEIYSKVTKDATTAEINSGNSPKAVSKHKIPIATGAQSPTAGYGSVDKNCS
ncbi:protein unc-93 homolog A-like [Haliotis rufescens]|uniref:protein unc-93 homolog A-like n=1 Tax=Haliotis rufescens TaxID=6454 RepID=UPI00201F9B8F|nr:protein unc-93 homolog A-like [Haliotis rufescens]